MKQRVDNLRTQPQAARLRAAVWFTAISGGAITLIWLFVLLPTQLYITRPDGTTEPTGGIFSQLRNLLPGSQAPETAENQSTGGQVSGVQNQGSPSPLVSTAPPVFQNQPGAVIRPNPNVFVTDDSGTPSPIPSAVPVTTETPIASVTPLPS